MTHDYKLAPVLDDNTNIILTDKTKLKLIGITS